MTKMFLIVLLGSLLTGAAFAQDLVCPEGYGLSQTCVNQKKPVKGFTKKQIASDKLILCGREEKPRFVVVMDKAPSKGMPTTMTSDGDYFGRNGFDIFTDPSTKKFLLYAYGGSLSRIMINESQDTPPSAVSDFDCH